MKRLIAASLAACLLAVISYIPVVSAQTKIKLVLNWKYQGLQALFFIAQEKGYFKAEGLDVEIDQGEGLAASIIKMTNGFYNAGFGDTNAVIELASKKPAEAPLAVFMLYNVPPSPLRMCAGARSTRPKPEAFMASRA